MIVRNFISMGWHTVPLQGVLERTESGGKTIPIFEKGYRDKYSTFFNKKETELAGALTGEISGITIIDCDNDETYNMFAKLDPSYIFHFKPIGKKGGSIVYKYEDIDSFSIQNKNIKIDLLNNGRFVYLPTEGNKTKEPMKDIPCEVKNMPHDVKILLEFLTTKNIVISSNSISNNINRYKIQPLVKKYVESKDRLHKNLFKIITPMAFRGMPEYIMKGYLDPANIKEGYRSKYLSQVSAILGADISINEGLYADTMFKINRSLSEPLKEGELLNNIINYMTSGNAKIGNVSIWNYNEKWKEVGFSGINIVGDYYESFYDDIKNMYYLVNFTKGFINSFKDKNKVLAAIRSITGDKLTELMYDSHKRIYRTVIKPNDEFGHINDNEFNTFRQTDYLAILSNPDIYIDNYKRPETTIKFLESFIPREDMRNYLLRFLKTKLTTFKYSPIILYFLGVPGSGKDTFVSILTKIMSSRYVERPDSKVFQEKYNGFLEGAVFIQCDEYGDKLGSFAARREVLGKLKSYTGKDEIQIRAMHSDAYTIKHSITFILTANSNPLPIDVDDRRFCIFNTPNALHKQKWVDDMGGVSKVITNLNNEIYDFCYYLATEYPNLASDEYVVPPFDDNKKETIYNGLSPLNKIIFCIQYKEFEKLKELGEEYDVNITEGWKHGRLIISRVTDLYMIMTDNEKDPKELRSKLKSTLGVKFTQTTKEGSTIYFLYYKELENITPFSKQTIQPIKLT